MQIIRKGKLCIILEKESCTEAHCTGYYKLRRGVQMERLVSGAKMYGEVRMCRIF